jgi:hypothetical protein
LSLNPRFPREKARQGFDNVGFIGRENETTLIENRPRTSALDQINENSHFSFGLALDVRKNDRFVEPDITGPGTFCSQVAKVAPPFVLAYGM